MLSELLHQNTSQQFHLVKLEVEEGAEEESRRAAQEVSSRAAAKRSGSFAHLPAAAPVLTPSLQLESTMSLGGLITFRWKFHLHSYGGPLEQCAFLRSQMYLPLHEMIKFLSYQVAAEKQKNQKLLASMQSSGSHPGGGAAGAASSAAAHHQHHPAAGGRGARDTSLSLPLDSLSTADREAQAQRAAAGLVSDSGAGGGAPLNYDHFAQEFSFGQVGNLYVSALNRLSGEDASFPGGGGGGASQSFDPFQASQQQPMEASMDYDGGSDAAPAAARDRKPTAAARRSVKRDRSPSPGPAAAAASSSRAAVGIDRAYERDPDMDMKYADDGYSPSLAIPSASHDPGSSSSFRPDASLQSSLDIGGTVDEETGVYRESEQERARREMLQKQLEAAKKKKKVSRSDRCSDAAMLLAWHWDCLLTCSHSRFCLLRLCCRRKPSSRSRSCSSS
jgi:hypothetical protein